jgi:glutamine phosphoribosylpyrophosphate amidotransferase
MKLKGHSDNEFTYIITDLIKLGETDYIKFIKTEHIDNLECYGIEIKIGDDFIYYSGDTKEIKDYVKTDYTAIYQDLSNYKNGVHTNIDDFAVVNIGWNRIYGMHFDCQETIDKCLKFGFKISEKEFL